jgi:hypothetical protein
MVEGQKAGPTKAHRQECLCQEEKGTGLKTGHYKSSESVGRPPSTGGARRTGKAADGGVRVGAM